MLVLRRRLQGWLMALGDTSSQSELHVRRVESPARWRDFFKVRRLIYRNDSAAVVPLRSMEKLQLDTKRNPFYEHAKMQAMVCYRDRKPVGRIAAIKDDLHNDYYKDSVGFFGFFESIDDQTVAAKLLAAAESWLHEQGCAVMRGPVNPSMKSDFGVLVKGHETAPYIMMGHSPMYYERLLQNAGFEVAKRFFAFKYRSETDYVDAKEKWVAINAAVQRLKNRFPQLVFREVDSSNYETTIRDINELGNQVRSANYGFVPLTESELRFMMAQMKRIIRLDMIHVAYWEDQLVGFIVNLPDLNWALQKTWGRFDWMRMPQLLYWIKKTKRARVIALGVHEKYRKKGIAITLMKLLTDVSREYEEWELSWVVEDNLKSIRAIGRTLPLIKHKVYHLYEKPIKPRR